MIRYDIFAVKCWEHDQWCFNFMFTTRTAANKCVADFRYQMARTGYNLQPTIVHPAQWVVDAFLAAGNKLDERKY